MNLTSCNKCGVVFDKNRLKFPDLEEIEIDVEVAFWNGDAWIPIITCPVCGGKIPEVE